MSLLLLLPGVAQAQRDARVPDPDPELERKALQIADGFEINLFAADLMLAKPIQMNFDPAGRLWIASSEVYPQLKPGQKANDKILVLEDTDGDGRADRTTVFADGLLIPTGVEPGDGGAYVANSTELVHLRDTDGDGKADSSRVLLSGFGTEDTHHIIHTFRWGHDGLLYFNQSIYIHSHIETPWGPRRLGGGGIWQLRPENSRLEVFARGWVNTWGHHFDRWGQSFATDGAGGEGINYVVPGASYPTAVGASRILHGLNPGSPKHCGLEVVSGRHLPDDWQGNLITNDFRGHRVCRFVLKEDGAGYLSQEKGELIKTRHEAFRPIDVKMGPDGAIYIADWYNPIIQHGEVDFRDPRRDHVHGRIWRVTAKGRSLVPRPRLVDASPVKLLDALKAPEDWTRQQARRVLKERGRDTVLPALAAWTARLDPAGDQYEHLQLEALWAYQALDVAEPKLLATLLRAKDHRARAAAVRVLSHWHERLTDAAALLAAAVADDHPRVRLEAVRVLGQLKQPRAVELAMQALDRPVDRWLDYALWLTARELEPAWMPLLQAGRLDFGSKLPHLLFALQAVGSQGVVRPLVDMVQKGKVPADREESVLTLVAALGGPPELALVFDRALSGRQVGLLSALEQSARQRNTRPAGDLNRLAKLFDTDSDAVRAGAARLAGVWRMEASRPKLLELAQAEKTTPAVRQAAFDGLVALGGPASRESIERLSTSAKAWDVRSQAVIALAALDLKAGAQRAVELLATEQPGAGPAEVFTAFAQRKNGAAALEAALVGRKLPGDVAKVGVRAARTSVQDTSALVDALTKAGGLTSGVKTFTAAEMQQTVADVARLGDPARGEVVFRRADLGCLKCHGIAGAGGQVGPDMTSLGASAPVDYLIDSLVQPNKAVKEGYHSLVVATKDGKIVTGVKVRESNAELVLRDAEDREVTIPASAIDERAMGGSLMPAGLIDTLTRSELLDLTRFLSELGKVGPWSASKARLVRRWQALQPTPEARTQLLRTGFGAAAGNEPVFTWAPVYSQVSGVLPLDSVPELAVRLPFVPEPKRMAFVRCQLDVTAAGQIKLLLGSARGVTLWLDRTPVEVKDEIILDVPVGVRTLTFGVDLGERQEPLRCELDDVAGSSARARLVGGK